MGNERNQLRAPAENIPPPRLWLPSTPTCPGITQEQFSPFTACSNSSSLPALSHTVNSKFSKLQPISFPRVSGNSSYQRHFFEAEVNRHFSDPSETSAKPSSLHHLPGFLDATLFQSSPASGLHLPRGASFFAHLLYLVFPRDCVPSFFSCTCSEPLHSFNFCLCRPMAPLY